MAKTKKRKTSAKQRAAARRNIKKAQSALRAKGGGGRPRKKRSRKGRSRKGRTRTRSTKRASTALVRTVSAGTFSPRRVAASAAPAPTLKTFFWHILKLGGLAALGGIGGELARNWLLTPKRDGSPSWLADFEAKHQTPVIGALVTAAPGVMVGGTLYYFGRKNNSPNLQATGAALGVGAVTLAGVRLLVGNQWVAARTRVIVGDRTSSTPGNQVMAPNNGYGSAGLPAAYTALMGSAYPNAYKELSGAMGDAFVPNPYGDAFVPNPYNGAMGDAFVPKPGPTFAERTGAARREVPVMSSYGSAIDEIQ